MWDVVKRWLAALRQRRSQPEVLRRVTANARITAVSVDPAKCLAHEWCVHVCPEVFEFHGTSARVRPGAAGYFDSHKAQILRAEDECPVQAIRVKVEGA
jgi:ferredoxin